MTQPTTPRERRVSDEELQRSLMALRLEAPESVCDDVRRTVEQALAERDRTIEELRGVAVKAMALTDTWSTDEEVHARALAIWLSWKRLRKPWSPSG